jgi:hypothetical protein
MYVFMKTDSSRTTFSAARDTSKPDPIERRVIQAFCRRSGVSGLLGTERLPIGSRMRLRKEGTDIPSERAARVLLFCGLGKEGRDEQ